MSHESRREEMDKNLDINDPMRMKLKKVRAEMEKLMKDNDVAGFFVLHAPGWSEVFWDMWPSYSVIMGDFPAVRIRSKKEDYPDTEEGKAKMTYNRENTSQMIHSLGTTMGGCAIQFLDLAKVVDKAFGSEHKDLGFIPDEPEEVKGDDNA